MIIVYHYILSDNQSQFSSPCRLTKAVTSYLSTNGCALNTCYVQIPCQPAFLASFRPLTLNFSHQSHQVHQVNICNQCKRPNAQMFKKLNMCFTKTCTAYKHQQDPTDSQAPVGLILFWFRADGHCWQGLKSVFRILQDFHMGSKHSNMIPLCRFNRQIPDFNLDFDLVKASNRLSN